jgi:hypothetical protein
VGVAIDAEAREECCPELRQLGRATIAWPLARDGQDLPDRRPVEARLRAEQDDAVGELECLVDVVRHEEHGCRRGGVDVEQEVLHLQPGQSIE